MTTLLVILIALAALILGFYLGRRSAASRWQEERRDLEYHYDGVIDYVDDYIEANAARWGVRVRRNAKGRIVALPIRCGTPALAMELMEKRRQRAAKLH